MVASRVDVCATIRNEFGSSLSLPLFASLAVRLASPVVNRCYGKQVDESPHEPVKLGHWFCVGQIFCRWQEDEPPADENERDCPPDFVVVPFHVSSCLLGWVSTVGHLCRRVVDGHIPQ